MHHHAPLLQAAAVQQECGHIMMLQHCATLITPCSSPASSSGTARMWSHHDAAALCHAHYTMLLSCKQQQYSKNVVTP
jgi:hypothetical protein